MQALLNENSLSNGMQLAIIFQANQHFDWRQLFKARMRYMLDRLYDHSAKSSSWIAVSAVISFLTAQGINRVKASAAIGNDASVMLFEKLNFTMLGIEADELTFCLNVI